MNRQEAISHIMKNHRESIFIFSNGLTSRHAAYFHHSKQSFYLLHAMGEALSVGIGLASALPDIDVVVVDGDGNALMGASSWVLNDFENIHYYILANKTYDTTGGQRLPDVDFPSWSNVIHISNEKNPSTPNPPGPIEIIKNINEWLVDKGLIE